jgi:proline iminopeptidase
MKNIFKRKIKPVVEGYLPEEDGHKVYWARYGNLKGKTILMFHGGPGGKSQHYYAGCYNLNKYNVIQFDQRGCGKSEPAGKLENNNKDRIISDAKKVLDLFKVKKAVIQGGSWGSTVALLFCEKYPKVVEKMIVTDVWLASKEYDVWTYDNMQYIHPETYEVMVKDKPKNKKIADYYFDLIMTNKKSDAKKVLNRFFFNESTIGNFPVEIMDDIGEKKIKESQLFLHFFKNDWFLKENEIMKNIKSISNKPCLIIHNRFDFLCPIKGSYEISRSIKKSKLVILPVLGHNVFRPESMKQIKKEIAEFLEK